MTTNPLAHFVITRTSSPDDRQGVPAAQPSQPTGWRAVVSSHLSNVAYDHATEELRVQFLDNSIYAYRGVPEDVFDGLLNAGSKGRYFRDQIRGSYPYSRVG